MRPLWARDARGYFSPLDLGASKLRLWLRPESDMFTTSGGSTPSGTGDPVGRVVDESGNGFNALQTVSGNRPTRKANGGLSFGGSHWLVAPALDAWDADYCVGVVCKSTSSSSYERITEVDYSLGHALTMLNDSSGHSKSAIYDPTAPYGMAKATSLGTTAHTLFDSRVGTAHEYQVDGGSPATRTLTGGQTYALMDTAFHIAAFPGAPGSPYSLVGDIHEVFVVASPTADDIANLKAYLATRVASGVYS